MTDDKEHKIEQNKIRREILHTLSEDLNMFVGEKISCITNNGVDMLQGGIWCGYDDGYFILIAKSTLGYKSNFSPRYNISNKKQKTIVYTRTPIIKECAECGKDFTVKRRAKYCSAECRKARNLRVKIESRGSIVLSEADKDIRKTKRQKAREEDVAIMKCSTECLVKELGDIE